MNNTPKVVLSTTLRRAELKQRPGRNIVVSGSPTLVRWLLSERLLNEIDLTICPVVLGDGKRLFETDGSEHHLELISSEPYSNGAVQLAYRAGLARQS